MSQSARNSIGIVIPTFNRGGILLQTLERLLSLGLCPKEILIMDQSDKYEPEQESRLQQLHEKGSIKWHKLPFPSITGAMNQGLMVADSDIVLFLDDDVVPTEGLLEAHLFAYENSNAACVAGRVVQPWESRHSPVTIESVLQSCEDPDSMTFNAVGFQAVSRFIGCNFSVDRKIAIEVGGFDMQFSHVAYRFEAEFADRVLNNGFEIRFFGDAMIEHLHFKSGGTRSFGDAFNTIKPYHSVGRYYYLLVANQVPSRISKLITMPIRSLITKSNLRRPWKIPMLLIAEIWGLIWAILKSIQGRKLIQTTQSEVSDI